MSDDRYVVVLTEPLEITDDMGLAQELPIGYVVNAIVWDGLAPYDPGLHRRVIRSDTLQIGDIAD